MRETVKHLSDSKSFSFCFQNLSRSAAYNFIKNITEQAFILHLHELTPACACKILNKFDRNEQDINASLKYIAGSYPKTDQPYEELHAYAAMGISQWILIEELNPRPD